MPSTSFEELVQSLANAIGNVWAAEWARADFSYALTQHFNKDQIKALAGQLGRSHQDVYRWSKLAEQYPPEIRAHDRSPREHARWMREAERNAEHEGTEQSPAGSDQDALRDSRQAVEGEVQAVPEAGEQEQRHDLRGSQVERANDLHQRDTEEVPVQPARDAEPRAAARVLRKPATPGGRAPKVLPRSQQPGVPRDEDRASEAYGNPVSLPPALPEERLISIRNPDR